MTATEESPKPVGTFVTFQAEATDSTEGEIFYRFRVREAGGTFRTVRDYGPLTSFFWGAVEHEGFYEIEVSARNRRTGEVRSDIQRFEATAAPVGGKPVITATQNPLVFLYSAPPCASGLQMRVAYHSDSTGWQVTPQKECNGEKTMNFYVAGLRLGTKYSAQHQILGGQEAENGPAVSFETDAQLPIAVPTYGVQFGEPQAGVLVRSALNFPSIATDLAGNLVWYYPYELTFITRPGPNGTFWGIAQTEGQPESMQGIKKFDLAGMTILETNAERLNEQLEAMGKRRIGSFHHEVRELPDGKILALASVEEEMENVQGEGIVNILGDMILVLDSDLKVVWVWDSFDYVDPSRAAILGETCPLGGCPTTYRAPVANDWLHTNSVQLTPDGNFIASIRHLDIAVKIDYQNGAGSGRVLWELGKNGHFTIDSTDPEPWFSHQHDVQYINDNTIILFDNANTRFAGNDQARSRGQVIRLDEESMHATLVHNFDLGVYSFALGSAQQLPNGNFHFNIGYIPPFAAMSVEVDPDGQMVYATSSSTAEYRTVRMASVYQE